MLESNVLEYVPELNCIESDAGVKLFFPDGSLDVLDPATVSWHSDNTQVAEVMANGAIIPKSEGTVNITADYQGLKNSVAISVCKGSIVKLNLVSGGNELKHMMQHQKARNRFSLMAIATTSSGRQYDVTEDKDMVWSSNNPDNASVFGGRISTMNPGRATITASFKGVKATSDVIVDNAKVMKVSLSKKQVLINDTAGMDTVALSARMSDGSTQDISDMAEWSSDNPAVAMACEGRIDAFSEGTATITVQYENFTDTIAVQVKQSNEPKYDPVFP
ncbi:hypothetical protein [Syntrophomonas palmitatica]|uniref:hypothetical protein n=1 Tax=Syntrophomonas palmitatica TaxID=402877 RepID=UPI0006D01061|nr:hypothetical protein [Syntrophomonas palmitatica]